jgi:hypothetical protein
VIITLTMLNIKSYFRGLSSTLLLIGDQIMGLRQDIVALRKDLAEYNNRQDKDIRLH